jgi:pimeloyl-ACP methyl ester carboxylesterase
MSKGNIVLVHGAWADGSCWSKVILSLEKKGYTVTAAQIPLTSLDDDIEVTRRLLDQQQGPTVVVGHSYGGAVITGAAAASSNGKALVYITAFGLDEGESLESVAKQGPPPAGAAAVKPDAYGFLWIDRDKFPHVSGGSRCHGCRSKALECYFIREQTRLTRLEETSLMVSGLHR